MYKRVYFLNAFCVKILIFLFIQCVILRLWIFIHAYDDRFIENVSIYLGTSKKFAAFWMDSFFYVSVLVYRCLARYLTRGSFRGARAVWRSHNLWLRQNGSNSSAFWLLQKNVWQSSCGGAGAGAEESSAKHALSILLGGYLFFYFFRFDFLTSVHISSIVFFSLSRFIFLFLFLFLFFVSLFFLVHLSIQQYLCFFLIFHTSKCTRVLYPARSEIFWKFDQIYTLDYIVYMTN